MLNKNFYPTPKDLIFKMLSKIDLNLCNTILEPSAGKGDIVDMIVSNTRYNRGSKPSIDTIEYDKELQVTLKGKGYHLIHDDFLTFDSFKKYDVILMNPPFDNGVKHLLKAIDIQSRGGKIVCILNAETIKNPYSNERDKLIRLLEEYEAEVEFMENQFSNAERKTDVEIALIYIDIPKNYKDNLILDNLRNEIEIRDIEENNTIITNDPMKAAILRYKFEVEAGLDLLYNYFSLEPLIADNLKVDSYSSPILELKVRGQNSYGLGLINTYIEQVRYKYWKGLIDMDKFRQILTTNLISEFHDKLNDLKAYDFTEFNINQVMFEIQSNLVVSVEETIYELFVDFTRTYTYDEYSSNIHLFDGWKTNISYKINDRRVIYPRLSAWCDWTGQFRPGYHVEGRIRDIEKALNYLDGGRTKDTDSIKEILEAATKSGQSKRVEFKYFFIDFYKKGTGHIIWKDKELIKKLNIFGSKREGSLPPSYGKKSYNDMTDEEKKVIDSFEGEKEYRKTMNDTNFYLYDKRQILMLEGGL